MIGSDKITFTTFGWDEVVRRAFDQYSDRILFAFPRDTLNKGTFGAVFFLGAGWANVTGRLMTEYFPFWYDDTWANIVGALANRYAVLDMDVHMAIGPTIRMHNVLFWERFFMMTMGERIREAAVLIGASCEATQQPTGPLLKRMEQLLQANKEQWRLTKKREELLLGWEQR
jgi:hypothetical protein